MRNINGMLSLLALILHTGFMHGSCTLGSFTPIPGTPPSTGRDPFTLTYSPLVAGNLFAAVPNPVDNNISVFAVNTTTGALSAVSGSPFITGTTPRQATYSPLVSGNLFAAVTNTASGSVSIYTVNNSSGVFTQVPSSPFLIGGAPFAISYSPLVPGGLFAAITDTSTNTVSVYQVNTTTGAFTAITGSPFSTGSIPYSLAFSPLVAGNLFAAITNLNDNTVSVYRVNTTTGAFTAVTGSPFSTGPSPYSIAFSPIVSGNLFAAVANGGADSISVYQVNVSTGFFTPLVTSPIVLGIPTYSVAYSPLVAGNLFAAVPNYSNDTITVYTVNTTTGAFTPVTGSPFPDSNVPYSIAFSPILPGGLFAVVGNVGNDTLSLFQVNVIITTITTPSSYVPYNSAVTLNATITGGTAPFTVVWQDGFTQTASSSSVSRTVTALTTTTYYIASVTDSMGCVAGQSNTVTIGVSACST